MYISRTTEKPKATKVYESLALSLPTLNNVCDKSRQDVPRILLIVISCQSLTDSVKKYIWHKDDSLQDKLLI